MNVETKIDFNQVITDLFANKEHLLENITGEDFTHLLKLAQDRENSKHFLKEIEVITLLPSNKPLQNLWQAKDLFPGFHDEDFKNCGLDIKQKPIDQPVAIQISEMQQGKDGTFRDIFDATNSELWIKAENQHMILQIIEQFYDRLHLKEDGTTNFFPIELWKEKVLVARFVVRMYVYSGKLVGHVREFEDNYVWSGSHLHRVFTAVALKY